MSSDLLYDRKALVGLLRHQVRDHIEFTRRELGRVQAARSSLFWKIMAPFRAVAQALREGMWSYPPKELPTDLIRERLDAISPESLQTVEQLRQAVEQSAHLRQQASYALREIRESVAWELMGPFRALHSGLSGRRKQSEPPVEKASETPAGASGENPDVVGVETKVSSRDFHIWIYQDFLKPVTSPIITISGWCFCKRPGHARLQLRCRIGDREHLAEHGQRTDHVGETYEDYPQAFQSGFDFYGISLLPQDEDLALDVSIDGTNWHEVLHLPINNQLQPLAPAAVEEPETDSRQIAIYYSQPGNYFYREIALYLARALELLGYSPHVLSSDKPFHSAAGRHLVVSPNEFYFLGHFPRELANAHRRNILFLLADQPHTPWFKRSLSLSHLATHILDISHDTVPLLKAKGLHATYLPLGYLPDFPLYDARGTLPIVPETEALGREVRTFRSEGPPIGRASH